MIQLDPAMVMMVIDFHALILIWHFDHHLVIFDLIE